MRFKFRFGLMLMIAFAIVIFNAVLSYGGVDSRLVGTWKLDGINWNLYWVVRADGHYRIHGQDPKVMHRGRFEATNDTWSLSSPEWEDGGAYELLDADTWKATGKLGPGIWKRVWYPGQPQNNGLGIGGVCDLLTPEEISIALDAPVKNGVSNGGIDQNTGEPKEGCQFDSQFSSYDRIKIWIDTGSTTSNSFNRLQNDADSPIDVSGLGESAYASLSRNGVLQVKILGKESWDQSHGGMAKRGSILTISLYLKPEATRDDLPKLTKLARLMYSRYSGISSLHTPARSNPDISGPKIIGGVEKAEEGLKTLGEKSVGGISSPKKKGFFEKAKEGLTALGKKTVGGASNPNPASVPLGSILGGNTPSLPGTGICLVSEAEIQQHLGITVTKMHENNASAKGEQQQSICDFVNMQGHGEVRITFYLRTRGSVKHSWDIRSKSQGWTHMKGIGDDAYSYYAESSRPQIHVGALLGNSSLTIKWKGNSQFPTAPKPGDTDKLVGLLKLAISRLN